MSCVRSAHAYAIGVSHNEVNNVSLILTGNKKLQP